MNGKESKGLGDTIAKITSATKLDKLAEAIAQAAGKEDCGCKERQEKLNNLFPYKTQSTKTSFKSNFPTKE